MHLSSLSQHLTFNCYKKKKIGSLFRPLAILRILKNLMIAQSRNSDQKFILIFLLQLRVKGCERLERYHISEHIAVELCSYHISKKPSLFLVFFGTTGPFPQLPQLCEAAGGTGMWSRRTTKPNYESAGGIKITLETFSCASFILKLGGCMHWYLLHPDPPPHIEK